MRSVELFAGAGGLAIGMANAGFHHAAVVERDADACATFRENQSRLWSAAEWPLIEGDVRSFDYANLGDVTVVSGGPPCQPFSLGGKHRGYRDERDMFPEAVRAVRSLKPKAFVFENVKGLTRATFASYFGYIQLQLMHPSLIRGPHESWTEHRNRLEKQHTSSSAAEYNVVAQLLNAANYGVPQKRERVFFVGFRTDLGIEWSFPQPTHSEGALLSDQWVTGSYWDRHRISSRRQPAMPAKLTSKVENLRNGRLFEPQGRAWLTVRDAISDLPDPRRGGCSFANHVFVPGARSYAGHTGSPIDEPAKTLKAGDHGVPGGENMLLDTDSSVRYFTVREAARLQTFPDNYVFPGSWSENMRQLGNAVPVRLAEVVARSVASALSGSRKAN
jgi:DNA (cytosine-5)-methyltransferase 1